MRECAGVNKKSVFLPSLIERDFKEIKKGQNLRDWVLLAKQRKLRKYIDKLEGLSLRCCIFIYSIIEKNIERKKVKNE